MYAEIVEDMDRHLAQPRIPAENQDSFESSFEDPSKNWDEQKTINTDEEETKSDDNDDQQKK